MSGGSKLCFVCMDERDEDVVSNLCLCREAYVHPACLNEWIRVSGSTSCGVCKADYNVTTTTVHPSWGTICGVFLVHVAILTLPIVLMMSMTFLFCSHELRDFALFAFCVPWVFVVQRAIRAWVVWAPSSDETRTEVTVAV